jgi:hypothetical protein
MIASPAMKAQTKEDELTSDAIADSTFAHRRSTAVYQYEARPYQS